MKLPDDFDSAAAKVAGSLSTDPIDRAAGEVVAAQKVQAKSSLYSALLQSPDMAARAQQLGRRTGLPTDVVSRNLPEVERSAYLSDIDKMLDENPAVVQFLTSPQYAAMAHDDVENMGQVERKLRQFGGGATEGVGMALSGTGRLMDIVQRNVLQGLSSILLPTPKAGPMGLTPQAPTDESIAGPMIGDGWRELGGVVKNYARKELMIPQAAQTFGDKVAAGLGQVAGQVAMFPLDRGASMFAQGADVMGEKVDKDPASQGRKDLAVLGGAAVTGITERWALDKLLGPLAVPVKNQIAAAMARIGIATVAEGGQEFTENVLQDTLRKALTNRDAEIDIGQSIEEGGVGAAVGGIVRTIVEGALHIRVRGAQAQVAEQDAKALTELTQLAQASKLAQRDPASFQEFVKQAAQDGPVQDVYIDAKTFAQAAQAAGLQPEQLPVSVREQLGDALATGGSVRIPIDEYAAQIATTEYAQGLIDHLKTDPLGMSRAEAQVFMQSQLEDLQATVEKAMAEREGDRAFKSEIDQVRAGFAEQLAQANRFTADVNTAYANMLANFYAVTAAKAGMTPQQLVERYPLRVQAEGVAGAAQQFDQAAMTEQISSITGANVLDVSQDSTFGTGTSFTLEFPDAKVQMSVRDDQDAIYVVNIHAKDPNDLTKQLRGTGRGREAVEALRKYADSTGKPLSIVGVTEGGDKFWKSFDWLKPSNVSLDMGGRKVTSDRTYTYNPQVLNQSGVDQTQLPGFDAWSHGHQVVGMDEGHTFRSGEGVVVEALHGTTGDFDTFNPEKANIESDLGGGFYFTNNPADVGENYAGEGPDLTNKIERLAEQIASETDREYNDPEVVAEARAQFMANQGFTMPVFVRFDNPAVIGGAGETFLDYEEPYDEDTDEYGEPQGKLVDFVEALRDAASDFTDADADSAMSDVWESVSDEGGIGVSDLIAKLKASEALAYATDENGVLASTEIIRRAFAGAGFDGFIDTTVNRKFGSEKDVGKPMAGMDSDTVHFIAFNANQVASRIGSTWTRKNPGDSILKQGSGNRGQIAFGQDLTQVPSVITLFKGADLSTFLHESGHFFLEVQFDLASRVAGEAAMFGADTNTAAQQQLMADTGELLRWFGLSSIEEWYGLPMEQKRSYHEQFARGFEAYLFEGKAPSIELQGLFQRFRAWLMRVYKDLKALNVELTDEVRGVMDRMLATTEQITLAEQGRSMMPLFTAPEQAGMSVEEFAAYQDLGTQASQDAIEELQARTLRDMQWMERAKGREIKRLKRESADRRAEMTIEARREIMSQPVYRAWQFLTGKLSKDDKAAMAPEVAPKSTSGPIDASVDSLFVAIAKLGGLDRAEVQSQWGWDAKERSPQPLFGKPLLRRENGVSLDAMGELLAEYGYLPKDENGKFDARDLEDKFQAEYRGDVQFSVEYEYAKAVRGEQRPGEGTDLENLGAGRFDLVALKDIGLPEQAVQIMVDLKMTAKDGIHPDLVAESFGFTSGDELVRTLAVAEAPKVAIEQLTDQKMLEKYGELATPQAIERAAEQAIHNDTRARFVATELNALAKATGQPKVLASAARELAKTMIDRLLVRNVKPTQYAAAEVRAAKAAEQAVKSGDTETAASEKRNQLINTYATRSAINALADVEQGLRYLGKFNNEGTRKAIDVDYLDQIDTILERFDLRTGQSLRSIDRRKSLAKWMAEQEELGIEVDLPEKLTAEAFRQSYKDMTIEEFRGLVDSVKQIEHLGRLKETLLTAADNRRFADVVGEITRSVEENADGREVNNRTRDTLGNRAINFFKGVLAEHRKVASLARELDGFKDAGPVWRYLIDTMNTSGDREATMRAEATARLAEMVKPVLAHGRMGGKGQFFPSLEMSLNRSEQLAIALNLGNEGNTQRLLDGKGWTLEQVLPVMRNLTAADWQFVQQVWDFFESYRPQIGAMERRISGKEPAWVEPRPLTVQSKDGQEVKLRGGYYPIVYDPAESGRAEQFADAEAAKQMMKGAFVASTTRSSFIKGRAEKVTGRPIMLTWDALFRGANDVIHRLAWQEWVIDANRLIKNDSVDEAIRTGYGAETIKQFKNAIRDIAAGENAQVDTLSKGLNYVRSGAAVAGLGLNLMNAMLQPLGLSQSMVRVGTKWVAMGAAEWAKSPVGLVRQVHEKSEFMRNRSRTQQRELNEIRSVVQGKSEVQQKLDAMMFMPMTSLQLIADMPTWWGAYQKALAQAPVDLDAELVEERAVKLADQSVIDAQGGGQTKDLAAVQRSQLLKLFTVFYGYFSTTYNLGVERAKATNFRSPLEVMHLAWDYLLLFSVPAVLATIMKSAMTPGGEEDDPEKLAKKLASEQISYLMGMMIGVREATGFVQGITGTSQFGGGYSGPAGLRFFSDLGKLGKQVSQGELDEALRRSLVNVGGVLLHLPSGQVNKTLDGINALNEGKTDNPAALLFGVER